MPIYVRLGMHLLFVDASTILSNEKISDRLTNLSIKQGEVYDKEGDGVGFFFLSFPFFLADLLARLLAQSAGLQLMQ
jgi:phosphatidylserine decarboxylase